MAVKYVWYRLFEDGKKIGNVIKYDINLKSKYFNTDVLIDEVKGVSEISEATKEKQEGKRMVKRCLFLKDNKNDI